MYKMSTFCAQAMDNQVADGAIIVLRYVAFRWLQTKLDVRV